MSRLEFGRPQTVEQAFLRLPTLEHPYYRDDEAIEHLAHLNLILQEQLVLYLENQEILRQFRLEDRLVPLTLEDIQLMENYSFRRTPNALAVAQWEYIRQGNIFTPIYPPGDDEYKWWCVSELKPDLELGAVKLVCIETNRRYGHMHNTHYRSDYDSEFNVGLLMLDELNLLVQEITRWGR